MVKKGVDYKCVAGGVAVGEREAIGGGGGDLPKPLYSMYANKVVLMNERTNEWLTLCREFQYYFNWG